MFKTRVIILAILFGLLFLVVLGRLWQLQITHYTQYDAIARRNHSERLTAGMRGPILDRCGEVLAEDQPTYDLSVRLDRLHLTEVQASEVKAVLDCPDEGLRQTQSDALEQRLRQEPFVQALAVTIQRDEAQVAAGILKALDAVERKWASRSTPVRIVSDIDQKLWLALRATHEDGFRDPHQMFGKAADKMADQPEPAFPGLVCTVSMRRVYPHGTLAGTVLGALGEITPEEEEDLKNDALLIDNPATRMQYWTQTLDSLTPQANAALEKLLHVDPREVDDMADLYQIIAHLTPAERTQLAALKLEAVARWVQRPPRMQLNATERICLNTSGVLADRQIGEQGVERWYNERLRGKCGLRKPGETIDDSEGETGSLRPQDGSPLALTLSLKWQRAIENALKGQEHPGAVVVLDVKTGEVLALASWPDFDPNVFTPPRESHNEKLVSLLHDPNKPLLNRAISQSYPLGSVMKTLVAAAALEKGVVTPEEQFECRGFLKEGSQIFHCDEGRSHGMLNVVKAIRRSCNVTFYQIGARLGCENLGPFARLFFGSRTGIDLPGEAPGVYPDRAWREKTFPHNSEARVWTKGQDYLLAIGQGQFNCTPLQVAVLMAAVANGGTVYTPRLWLEGASAPGRSMGVRPAMLNVVRQGLDEVVNYGPLERGTAYTCFHEHGELAVRVAGKTSTAQHKVGAEPHAWFAGYAPADNPQVAFAILLEEGGHGGATAAPVAYQFLKEVYGMRAGR